MYSGSAVVRRPFNGRVETALAADKAAGSESFMMSVVGVVDVV